MPKSLSHPPPPPSLEDDNLKTFFWIFSSAWMCSFSRIGRTEVLSTEFTCFPHDRSLHPNVAPRRHRRPITWMPPRTGDIFRGSSDSLLQNNIREEDLRQKVMETSRVFDDLARLESRENFVHCLYTGKNRRSTIFERSVTLIWWFLSCDSLLSHLKWFKETKPGVSFADFLRKLSLIVVNYGSGILRDTGCLM